MGKEQSTHHQILSALYEMYKSTDDAETLNRIANVAWGLGVNLNYDYGYHELSELCIGKTKGSTDGKEHYTEVIERNLKELNGK